MASGFPTLYLNRAKHEELYAAIAARNEQVAVSGNAESAAVARKRAEHEQQFAAIAAEHERIAEAHRHGCQMAIAQFLDCVRLALGA